MNVLGAQPKLRIKNEKYEIYDLSLEDFTLSVTCLERGKSTLGHSHAWEEVYYIIKGCGRIQIQDKTQDIRMVISSLLLPIVPIVFLMNLVRN